jgi:ABC-type polar amino acid transport system ATPase subunit
MEVVWQAAALRRALFVIYGLIVERSTPDEFFKAPKEERTHQFLSQILH